MINKLLITCLQRNKRLIIPTLGAFIRKNIDGVGVILVFVPFLNKDDGVLLGALQSWAGVDKEEAEIILKEYIECIRKSLEERGQYIIEGIGVLKYDANHMIYLAKEGEVVKESVKEVEQPAPVEPAAPAKVEVVPPVVEIESPVAPVAPVVEQPQYVQPLKEEIISEPVQPQEPSYAPSAESVDIEPESHVVEDSKEPRPGYGVGNRRGTRYFTPDQAPSQEGGESKPGGQRKNTINNLYGGGGSSRTTGAIYGSAALDRSQRAGAQRTAVQPQSRVAPQVREQYDQEQVATEQPQTRVPNKNPNRRPAIRHVEKPKKKIDMVMVVAAIAVVVTIISMVYAFFWSSEATLEENIYIEQPVMPVQQVDSSSVVSEM